MYMHARPLQPCLSLCIPWTVAPQAPLSTGFSRQEYWGGLPRSPPRDLPGPGMEPAVPVAPALQANSSLLSHGGSPALASTGQSILATENCPCSEGQKCQRNSGSAQRQGLLDLPGRWPFEEITLELNTLEQPEADN